MPEGRPDIPRPLEREVLIEAGHRCAIPRCQSVPVVLAHIVPWSQVEEHTFDNLIALCPTCHARYDNGQIDRLSMRQYKANLSLLNSRYGDVERRMLKVAAEDHVAALAGIPLPGGMDILVMNVVNDGLFTPHPSPMSTGALGGVMIPTFVTYVLTTKGLEFVQRWLSAGALE